MNTYNMSGNDAGIQAAPLSFLRGGWYDPSNGARYDRGSRGDYWEPQASTANHTYGYYLISSSSSLNPRDSYIKGIGRTLRCIVRIPPSH